MSSKSIKLDLASFLDEGSQLPHARAIVERLLTACYNDLGKPPRLLDGEHARVLLREVLPGHFAKADAAAPHVPEVLRAYVTHLEETQFVPEIFELRNGLEEAFDDFLATVASGESASTRAQRPAPVKHVADKLGRNAPCFCGSGRKFKKCCGQGV